MFFGKKGRDDTQKLKLQRNQVAEKEGGEKLAAKFQGKRTPPSYFFPLTTIQGEN